MKITTPTEFLEHVLQDLYSAENQIVEALPKMAQSATSSALTTGFEDHLEQTKTHVARLKEVADLMDIKIEGMKCKGMAGLIEESEEAIKNIEDKELLDLALVLGARKVEHYEILAYTIVIMMLKDNKESADILEQTLREEEETDKKLTDMIVG